MLKNNKRNISIVTVWLFNIAGIIGILSPLSEVFLKLTPLNLSMYVMLIFWNLESQRSNFMIAFSIPFFIGFITEYLGVNYGWIFGDYIYGENLGVKIGGVPFMICVNWTVLTIITADIAMIIHKNLIVRSLIGGMFMMLLDLLIEVSAPRFDFWEFESNTVPLQNYLAWFVIGSIAHYFYNRLSVKTNKGLSIHILIAIFIFFLIFLIF